jgi:hypothetical protein
MRRWLVLRQPDQATLQDVVTIPSHCVVAAIKRDVKVILNLLLQHHRPGPCDPGSRCPLLVLTSGQTPRIAWTRGRP